MHTLLSQLELFGIIPVVVLDDPADAPQVAGALNDGGLPCAEVTFRTAAAPKAIEAIVTSFPGVLVGAVTVLTVDQVQTAVTAVCSCTISAAGGLCAVEARTGRRDEVA